MHPEAGCKLILWLTRPTSGRTLQPYELSHYSDRARAAPGRIVARGAEMAASAGECAACVRGFADEGLTGTKKPRTPLRVAGLGFELLYKVCPLGTFGFSTVISTRFSAM
jgi:hypothetical protein